MTAARKTAQKGAGRAPATEARPEDEKLPIGTSIAFGFQHVLTMYGGIIAPPLIIGAAAGMSSTDIGLLIASCLFVGGLATLLQTIGIPWFGAQLPLVQGVSFASVATMTAIVTGGGGIQAVFGAVIVSAAIGLLITPVFSKIIRFFPPVVTGSVITMIGLSLLPVAAGEIVGGKVDAKRIGNGLRADMLSSLISPVFNSFTQSAFAQNVGLVAITKVKSRFVVSAGGGILVVLGLLPILGRVVAAVPMSVLGGAGIVLFGTVAASGIRTLSKVEYRDNMNLIIVAASIGVGMLPVVAPAIYEAFPAWFVTIFHSGISSAAIVAILLNILFNHITWGNSKGQSVFVAAPPRMVREEELAALEDGDHYLGGKLIAADGREVQIIPTGSQPVIRPARAAAHKQNAAGDHRAHPKRGRDPTGSRPRPAGEERHE